MAVRYILILLLTIVTISSLKAFEDGSIKNTLPADELTLLDLLHTAISSPHKDSILSFAKGSYIHVGVTNVKFKAKSHIKDLFHDPDGLITLGEDKYADEENNYTIISLGYGFKTTIKRDFHITAGTGFDFGSSDVLEYPSEFEDYEDGFSDSDWDDQWAKKSYYVGYSNHISYYGYSNKLYALLTTYTAIFQPRAINIFYTHPGYDNDWHRYDESYSTLQRMYLYSNINLRAGKVFDINNISLDGSFQLGYSDIRTIGGSTTDSNDLIYMSAKTGFLTLKPGLRVYSVDNFHLFSLGINELSWNYNAGVEVGVKVGGSVDTDTEIDRDGRGGTFTEDSVVDIKSGDLSSISYNLNAALRMQYNGAEILSIGYQYLHSGNVSGHGFTISAHFLIT